MRRMMLDPIPSEVKQVWDTCDLRGFMILSLSLQMVLIYVAPLRKRIKSNFITMPLWSAYLLADWAANFAVGLILSSQGDPDDTSASKKDRKPVEHADLLAFWASFLLVHLGGPDTITAFALEDNELWLRHLFGLVFQCVAVVYVFLLSLPDNRLWIPTVLIFLTGMIKYIERTRSLYLASSDRFKSSMLKEAKPDTNSSKLMHIYDSMREAKLPARIESIPDVEGVTTSKGKSAHKAKRGELTKLEVVQYGYQFYEKFIGLFVDMIYSVKERNQSRDFFLNRNAKDTFKVIEVELNLIYEVLYTKLPVVYGRFGAFRRFFSLVATCLAIIIFIMQNKTNYTETDVMVTYCLLFGALFLDLTALFMLLFSDWTIITLRKSPDAELDNNSLKTKITTCILTLATKGNRKVKGNKSKAKPKGVDDEPKPISCRWKMGVINRRWSETISTFNLIYYSLNPRRILLWEKTIDLLGLTNFFDDVDYVKPKSFSPSLRDFIFDELKSKSEFADDLDTTKEISSARGDWVLRAESGWNDLLKYVVNLDYDQSLILWHVATDLCYNKELYYHSKSTKHREISKIISDYMMYLLFMQPNMMSAVAGIAHIRFLDACTEVCAHVKKISNVKNTNIQSRQVNACMAMLNASAADMNSLLFESVSLAKKLMEIEEKDTNLDKWKIMSKVWVEMLSYAASHSRANMQVAQVSNGGELITIVWLLMTHLGLGEKYQQSKEKRLQLFVGK